MDEDIKIIERAEIPTVEISARTTMLGMPFIIPKSYKAIMSYLDEVGIEAADAPDCPYVHYFEFSWDQLKNENKLVAFFKCFTRKWVMNIGIPVKQPVTGSDKIQAGTLPGGKFITTIHRGPYQQVGKTYKKIMAWIDKNDIAVIDEAIEIYTNDPRGTPSKDLETIILVPVQTI